MEPKISSSNLDLVVVDASAVISLNATRCAAEIIGALPYRIVVTDIVTDEIESGRSKGRNDGAKLAALVEEGKVNIVTLGPSGLMVFESLVVGPAGDTLDDGEAATIAYATELRIKAIIDERKATRLCSERFPKQPLGYTVDLLGHEDVQRHLGQDRLADAVHAALVDARMRVLPRHMDWLVGLIGDQRVANCVSLPEAIRRAARSK